jgi:type II secretory pathway predicted ATPase ExeA
MIIDQVRGYFGFERMPFDRSVPVSRMFGSTSHKEAVARIEYAIATRALAALTGEVGAGKTAAVRAATTHLDASRHQLIYLPNPQVGARGIHHAVVSALGGTPRFHHATLIPQAADALASELTERGRLPVIVVDEAHMLAADQLEAIRMLTNADLDSGSVCAILLIGQPQLRLTMKLSVLAALDQRVAVRYQMQPMTIDETSGYLRHHTRLAGRNDTLFSDDAAAFIHHTSRGYPRSVNRLAVAALIATYTSHKTIADETTARAAAAEMTDQ